MRKRPSLARPLLRFKNIQLFSVVVRRKSLKKRTTSGVHSTRSSKKVRLTVRSFRNCRTNSHSNGNFRLNPRNSTEELAVAPSLSRKAAVKCGRLRLRFRGHLEFPLRGEGLTFWCWCCQWAPDARRRLPQRDFLRRRAQGKKLRPNLNLRTGETLDRMRCPTRGWMR